MSRYLLMLWIFCGLDAVSRPPQMTATSPWVVYKWGKGGQYRPYAAPESSFAFPTTGNNVAYPAFLTTTTITEHLGNLNGQTISATLNVSATGNPTFVWGGLLSGWNTCCLPANTRLFISTSAAPYSNSGYKACPSCYWWSQNAWVQVSPTTGTVIITDTFDPSHWSNANGQLGTSVPAAFATAIANVRQIGLAFGGGSFFDVGVAIQGSGTSATFHLLSFSSQ